MGKFTSVLYALLSMTWMLSSVMLSGIVTIGVVNELNLASPGTFKLFALAEEEAEATPDAEAEDVAVDDEEEDDEDDDEDDEEDDETGGPGQPNTADAERIERVYATLTPECQEEMRNAYSEGGTLSDECTLQIQNAFKNDMQQQQQAGADAGPPKELGPDPSPYIFGFLAIAFTAVGVKVFNIQQELKKIPPKKTKQLSKRKKEKLKQKEQRRQGTQVN